MKTTSSINWPLSLASFGVCTTMLLSPAAAQLSFANFDGGFQTSDILPFPSSEVDKWSAERADVVVGLNNGILPANGNKMLRLLDNGSIGEFNQVSQRVGVEHLAAIVDAGNLAAGYYGCFNVPPGAAGATADIFLKYFDESNVEIGESARFTTAPLDADTSTWEHVEFGGLLFDDLPPESIPAGTRQIEAHFQFDNASLNGLPGFADKMHVGYLMVPEPSSLSLWVVTAVALAGYRKRCA